jgi:hypothetical protein
MLIIEDLCVNLHPNWKKVRKMKQIKLSIILAMTILLMGSCLEADNESSMTLYNDAAITGFTLGTLNKYVDDTKTTFSGSTYFFNVDQSNTGVHTFKDTTIIGRCVYNNDSLPLGTDLKHVVATLTTLNNGIAIIESLDEPDYYDYFDLLDSIDFTKPRKVRVYSSDGSVYNQYYICVNAHQEDGSKFVWQLMDDEWTATPDEMVIPDGIKQILGGSTTEKYAMSTDNKLMVSFDNGTSWQEDIVNEDADMLPTRDLSLVSYAMTNTDSVDYVLLVGNREVNEQNGESIAMVWRKVVDYSRNATKASWNYMERNADSDSLALPRLKNLTMVKYDDGVLALGAEGIGGCTNEPYSMIYQSRDNGITWKYNPYYILPEEFNKLATKVSATVDGDNFIWLHCEGTGQVWRGRLNKLGWKNQK